MVELSFEYWNKLADQFILTAVFLGGFSIAITANLLINKTINKLYNSILKLATVSSGSFLIAVFAMTDILMMTTEGYPLDASPDAINTPRLIGFLGYILGVVCLFAIIGLSGWTKSRGTGIFTSVVAIITLVFFLILL